MRVITPDASGRKLPCYNINTRDGFQPLAMGFTGKRAAQFKEAYINAFNQMEKQLTPSVLSDAAHTASVLIPTFHPFIKFVTAASLSHAEKRNLRWP